ADVLPLEPAAAATAAARPRRRPGPVPAPPPDDREKYSYLGRNLPYLTTGLVVSAACLVISQLRFEAPSPALWPFLAVPVAYLRSRATSLPVTFPGRGFDAAAHLARVAAGRRERYPSVDISLPICGEPIEMLRGTWDAVSGLIAAYPGPAQAYVL